jgi:hypothetical protein
VIRRRHPSALELGAFFDGELIDGVSEHVARCRKCREALVELHGVRSAVRGELDLTDGSARRRARWAVALLPVAAAVALLVAVAAPPGGLPVTRVENADESSVAPAAAPDFPTAESSEAATSPAPPVERPAARDAAAAGRDTGPGAQLSAGAPGPDARPPGPAGTPGAAAAGTPPTGGSGTKVAAGRPAAAASPAPAGANAVPPPAGPLHLGVPIATRGPSSGEGGEVLRAVRAVVDAANGRGGVAGRRVEMVAVPTDDDQARASALGRVDALVGGFAVDVPDGMPWVMPADTVPAGPDVTAAELAADQAGAALAADLVARLGAGRTVGAIIGAGPDAGLAAGLARSLAVQQVEAGRNTSCDQEIIALRRREVAALALAVPPDLARRCAGAATRLGWRPAGGLLVAPSAVYAHLERDLIAQGARSALALAVPNGDDAGVARFRQAAPGCESYRSMVSFAAAELALDAAGAANGVLTTAGL